MKVVAIRARKEKARRAAGENQSPTAAEIGDAQVQGPVQAVGGSGFAKLPHDVQRRIVATAAMLADDPRPAGVVKLAGDDNLCALGSSTIAWCTKSTTICRLCWCCGWCTQGRSIGISPEKVGKKARLSIAFFILCYSVGCVLSRTQLHAGECKHAPYTCRPHPPAPLPAGEGRGFNPSVHPVLVNQTAEQPQRRIDCGRLLHVDPGAAQQVQRVLRAAAAAGSRR